MASLRNLSVGYLKTFRKPLTRSRTCRTRILVQKSDQQYLRRSGFDRVGFKEPEILKSYEQKLAEENASDSEVDRLVNIGFSNSKVRSKERPKEREQHAFLQKVRRDSDLEKASRHHKLTIPLDDVKRAWEQAEGPEIVCGTALHYGIFRDLFGAAYFIPQVNLHVAFPSPGDFQSPVYRGNLISPGDALSTPSVQFEAPKASLWTLMLANCDGHLQDTDSQYVHWFVGNIPENEVERGEVMMDYLQPIPLRGTGFHRYVFLLYKQEKPMDYSAFKRPAPCKDLPSRTIRMTDFYRQHQDDLTPTGIAFFQSEWDDSVTKCFHKILNMQEPAFEYEPRPIYIAAPKKYPTDQPFNLYLDRYRDKKDIALEMVRRRLINISPFTLDEPKRKWPMAQVISLDIPSWKRIEIKKERIEHGRYKLLTNPLASWPK